ncbi:hypothetical protein BS78_04G122500 [Paspalum vaginatum]|nr:hypothetical protein BS78_04G122500 [Paspalum vaginatum]
MASFPMPRPAPPITRHTPLVARVRLPLRARPHSGPIPRHPRPKARRACHHRPQSPPPGARTRPRFRPREHSPSGTCPAIFVSSICPPRPRHLHLCAASASALACPLRASALRHATLWYLEFCSPRSTWDSDRPLYQGYDDVISG